MALDLSSLQKAVKLLESSVHISCDQKMMGSLNQATRELIRLGVIQHFEFTFELCWKFMERWIRLNKAPEAAQPSTRKDLFRHAAKYELVQDPQKWFEYSEARNITSHTYEEGNAKQVYQAATHFVEDAKYFLMQLESKND